MLTLVVALAGLLSAAAFARLRARLAGLLSATLAALTGLVGVLYHGRFLLEVSWPA